MPAYFRPTTLEEALAIRAERPVVVLAGGTDIYPARAARVGWGDMRHTDVLDISAIEDLRGMTESATHRRLEALTTWTALRRATLPPAFAGYQAAAREIGGAQIQNRGTLVGNICTASPAGDGIPCLLTLDAEVELASVNGVRVVALSAFIDGYRHTICRPDEIVSAILVPHPPEDARGTFLKLGGRRYLVISIVMAAALLAADEEGMIQEARVAVGACGPVAQRLPALEMALLGQPVEAAAEIVGEEHLASLSPIEDIRSSKSYRLAAAREILRDLLTGFAAPQRRAA